MLSYVLANKSIVLGVLFGISEALSFLPGVKANGVFQLVFGALKKEAPALN